MTIPAIFPIGKTQWRKWNDTQRGMFNRARADGIEFADAVKIANGVTAAPEPAPEPVLELAGEPAPTRKSRAPRTPKGNK